MKIYIEVPNDWLDSEKLDNLSFITRTAREEINKKITKAIVEKIIESFDLSQVRINKQAISRRTIELLAERAIENY